MCWSASASKRKEQQQEIVRGHYECENEAKQKDQFGLPLKQPPRQASATIAYRCDPEELAAVDSGISRLLRA